MSMKKFAIDWIEKYKSYNRNIRFVLLATILIHIGMGIFMIIYNYYIRGLGYTEQMNGTVIAMQSTGTALFLLPAGILGDRIGRKKMVVFGALFETISLFLMATLTMESFLLAAAFMTGMFMSFIQVSAIPLLSENTTDEQRVHLFSLNFALMMLASVIGNILGGSLSDFFHYGIGLSSLRSIRMTLFIAISFYVVAFYPILKIKEQKVENVKNENRSFKRLLQKERHGFKVIILFAIAQMIIGFGSGLVIPYLNLYFVDRFQISHSLVGFIVSGGQAMTAVAMLIGPAVVNRVGEVRAVMILQLSSIPFLLLTAYTTHIGLAAFGFLFRQALMNAGNPIQMSLMMRSVDNSIRGLANSVGQAVFQLGWAVMGPISTTIVMLYGAYTGYAIVFTITGFLYVIGTVYFYIVFRKPLDNPRSQTSKTVI